MEDSVTENRLLSIMKNLCPLKHQVEQFWCFNISVIIIYFGMFSLKSLICTVYTLGKFLVRQVFNRITNFKIEFQGP